MNTTEGFMTLDPVDQENLNIRVRVGKKHNKKHSHNSQQPHTDLVKGHDAQYWYNQYQRMVQKYEHIVDKTTRLLDDLEERQQQCNNPTQTDYGELAPIVNRAPFDHGIGLEFGPGRSPRLYDISDPEGKTYKKKKSFDGIDVKFQPGRGFSITSRWK